jgi:CheY-specific phosphatase CheX
MSTENITPHIEINETVLDALIKATNVGLQMTGVTPDAVGCAKFPASKHGLSILVGLMGEWTGTLTLNMSEDVGLLLTEGLLGERPEAFNEEVLDVVGEVGNMISGAFKDTLENSEISLDGISCPTW